MLHSTDIDMRQMAFGLARTTGEAPEQIGLCSKTLSL